MRGHTKFPCTGRAHRDCRNKSAYSPWLCTLSCVRALRFPMPHSARGRARITLIPAFLQRVRVASSASSGQNDRFQHGNIFRHLRTVFEERTEFRPSAFTMCTRIERNSFKRYGGLFAALFAELFQRFTRRPFKRKWQCGFFIGVDLHRFAQYGVPPVFLTAAPSVRC